MGTIKFMIEYGIKLKNRFNGHDIGPRSAQMTYYWILAFFPFLIMIITILSYTAIAEGDFIHYLDQVVPNSIMPLIQDTLDQLIEYRSATLLSFGAIATLWSASAGMNVLIKGIHKAYNATDTRPFWIKKIISICYTFVFLFLIVAMIVFLVFGNKIGEYLLEILFGNKWLYLPIWDLFRFSLSIIGLLIGLYAIYKVIPRKHRKSNNVWPGTLFATVGWYMFSMIFSFYIDRFSNYNQMYGSIGGVFVLLIWLYTSGMVVLLGAEINALWQDIQIMKERKKQMKHRMEKSS